MQERSRAFLRNEFDDGERPTGADFADLIESFINKADDGISVDNNGNVNIPGGLTLGDTPNGQPGTLRFNGGQVEVFDGGAFQPVGGGGGGAFTPVGATQHVAYGAGNVGIGNFPNPPTHKLDVDIAANNATNQRVRLGQLVVHNGQVNDAAHLCHQNVAGNNESYALRQDSQGNTTLNAPANTQLILRHDAQTRLQVLTSGNMAITPQTSLSINGNTSIGSIVQNQNLQVFGQAFKLGGGPFNPLISDARIKKNIRPLDHGLEAICKLQPVYYKYNKASGLSDDKTDHIGLTAQNVQDHLPFLIQESAITDSDNGGEPLMTYDRGPLEFIMINAIKELAKRVETLEQTIEDLKKK